MIKMKYRILNRLYFMNTQTINTKDYPVYTMLPKSPLIPDSSPMTQCSAIPPLDLHNYSQIKLPDSPPLTLKAPPTTETIVEKLMEYIDLRQNEIQDEMLNKAVSELPTIKRMAIMDSFRVNKIFINYSSKAERRLWNHNIDRLMFLRIMWEKMEMLKKFSGDYSFTRGMMDCTLEIFLHKEITNLGVAKLKVTDVVVKTFESPLNKFEKLIVSCDNDYAKLVNHLANLTKKAETRRAQAMLNFRERKTKLMSGPHVCMTWQKIPSTDDIIFIDLKEGLDSIKGDARKI